jgi:hypothetical protein
VLIRWIAALALVCAVAAACAPQRPTAAEVPATSVVQPELVPGAKRPTPPVLSSPVAVSPVPAPVASPAAAAAASPSPAAAASPVLHPTLPSVGANPSPAPGGR